MALQRLKSPHKLKVWCLQVPARLQQIESLFSADTYCQKNICISEADREQQDWWRFRRRGLKVSDSPPGFVSKIQLQLRRQVSQLRPIRAALPALLHMRGSWDMYLQYPSLCHTHTTHYTPRGLLYKTHDARPLWLLCIQFRMHWRLFCICTFGRIGTDLKKADLHTKVSEIFSFYLQVQFDKWSQDSNMQPFD